MRNFSSSYYRQRAARRKRTPVSKTCGIRTELIKLITRLSHEHILYSYHYFIPGYIFKKRNFFHLITIELEGNSYCIGFV